MTLKNFAYTGNPITETISSSSQVVRTIIPDEGASVTMKADPYNGIAKFRYDRILCSFFKNSREEIQSDLYFDSLVATKATINGTTYVFSRGVAQIGEEAETPIYKPLTKMPMLRKYEGYELGVVLAITGTLNVYMHKNGQDEHISYQTQGRNIVFCDLQQFNGDGELVVYNGSTAMTRTKVVNTETPSNPFYVRWINNQGGYDYFMFGKNNTKTLSLEENNYYESYGEEGVMKTLSKVGKDIIEVDTGIIDKKTLDAISMLPYSPDIRFYNETAEEWLCIQVESTQINIKAEQPTGQMTISFVLPKPQINK